MLLLAGVPHQMEGSYSSSYDNTPPGSNKRGRYQQGMVVGQLNTNQHGSMSSRSSVSSRSGSVTPKGSLSPSGGSAHTSPLHSSLTGRMSTGSIRTDASQPIPIMANTPLGSAASSPRGYVHPGHQTQIHSSQPHTVSSALAQAVGSDAEQSLTGVSSTSVSSSESNSGTDTHVSQTDMKSGSFLQRATKFFQQQFQLDLKLPTDKQSPETTQSASPETPTNSTATPMSAEKQPAAQTPPSVRTQVRAPLQTGISPYRQMPVITRDQAPHTGYQTASLQQRQMQAQQYLQPPNYRGQRKISEPKFSSRGQEDSQSSLHRRSSAGSKSSRGNSPSEHGRSSPNVSRRARMLPSVAGRQPLGKF